MYFDTLHAVLFMDGHGVYVWVAYLVTLLVIVAALSIPVRRSKRFLGQLAAGARRAPGRAGEG